MSNKSSDPDETLLLYTYTCGLHCSLHLSYESFIFVTLSDYLSIKKSLNGTFFYECNFIVNSSKPHSNTDNFFEKMQVTIYIPKIGNLKTDFFS